MVKKRVYLASPTYGPVQPEVYQSVLTAVMSAAVGGVEWLGTAGTEREGWEEARNLPTEGIRDMQKTKDIDGILWFDSDMLVPANGFLRLLSHGVDLVSALYFQRKPPYWPNAYGWNPRAETFHRVKDYNENQLGPIGGFGFGCCYTSMKLINTMKENPFKFGRYSEDLGFCREAIRNGFQPYLDTGILCDHYIGPSWSNAKKFSKWKAMVLADTAALVSNEVGEVEEKVHG